jgi:hypothetical protein
MSETSPSDVEAELREQLAVKVGELSRAKTMMLQLNAKFKKKFSMMVCMFMPPCILICR